jgi:hypothetical protein
MSARTGPAKRDISRLPRSSVWPSLLQVALAALNMCVRELAAWHGPLNGCCHPLRASV